VYQGTNGLTTGAFTSSNTVWLNSSNLTWQATNALGTAAFYSPNGTIVTQNNSFALTLSNRTAVDAAHTFVPSNATPSRLAYIDAANNLSNAVVDSTLSLSSGSLGMPNTGTAGTYYKTTFDAQGRETSGVTTVAVADIAGSAFGARLWGNSVPTPVWLTPAGSLFVWEDFDWGSTSLSGNWRTAGSISAALGTSSASHPGVLQLTTGSSSSGSCAVAKGGTSTATQPLFFGGGVFTFEWVVMVDNLSDNTDNYVVRVGTEDNTKLTASGFPNNCVSFEYSNNTNSGKWFAKVNSASGTIATGDTGLAVVASTWYRLGAVINSGGTSTDFYTNGVIACTVSKAVPTANGVSPSAMILKQAAATARTLNLDLYWHFCALTTSR